MARGNLPITLLILGGGAVMVWVGISNPDEGLIGEIGRVLRGESRPDALGRKGGKSSAAEVAASIIAYSPSGPGGYGGTAGAAYASTGGGGVVAVARSQIGMPYVWGGGNSNGPTGGGFDCSGLAQFAYKKGAGIDIPRVAEAQRVASKRISESQAVAGDEVFFGIPAYHCGIYLGNGQMIHAPYPGTKVRIEPVKNVKPGPVTYGRFSKSPASAAV